jgi:hypothetical protein
MAKIDPEQERKRLEDFYAGQLDGELEKVAGEAYELSEIAKSSLKAELHKRGLSVELAEHAPITVKKAPLAGDPPEEEEGPGLDLAAQELEDGVEGGADDLVTIRKFRDLPEALLAKGSLDSAGIECMLGDANTVRLSWVVSNAVGGIKLMVNAKDVGAAEEVLSQPIPHHLDVSGVGEYEQPMCPKCGSLDISFQELAPVAYLSMWLNVPIPFHRRAWRCHACDVEWEDDGLPDTEHTSV